MEGLLAVSPYVHCPFEARAKGVVEAVAATALSDLNKLANEPYMAYLKRKLGEWYREAPTPRAPMISYLIYHIYYIVSTISY